MPDVIVTGFPRSGATVMSALIDGLPNAICLNRPMNHQVQSETQRHILPFCKWVVGDFMFLRTRLLNGETVRDFRTNTGPALDSVKDPRQIGAEFSRPELHDD